jgi:uncharacterized repeat protein (TIGR01451 family)
MGRSITKFFNVKWQSLILIILAVFAFGTMFGTGPIRAADNITATMAEPDGVFVVQQYWQMHKTQPARYPSSRLAGTVNVPQAGEYRIMATTLYNINQAPWQRYESYYLTVGGHNGPTVLDPGEVPGTQVRDAGVFNFNQGLNEIYLNHYSLIYPQGTEEYREKYWTGEENGDPKSSDKVHCYFDEERQLDVCQVEGQSVWILAMTLTPIYQPKVDIAIEKTVSPSTVYTGESAVFTVTATNNGPDNATNVEVTDTLPIGLNLTAASASKGSFNQSTGVWTIGSLAKDASATLTLTVNSNSVGSYTNTANLTQVAPTDTDSANNKDSATLQVIARPIIDLELTKVVGHTTPSVGDTVTYTITLKNNSTHATAPATGVKVKDYWPETKVTHVSHSVTKGSVSSIAGGDYLWNVGTLNAGQTAIMTIVGSVNAGTEGQTINNMCEVTAANETDFDSTPNNGWNKGEDDDDHDEIRVNTPPTPTVDISVNKTVDQPTAYVGNQVTFTVEVVNHGLDNATGVVLDDLLPIGLNYVSHTGDGSFATSTGVWTIGALNKNATSTLNIIATSNVEATYTNIAALKHVDQTDTNSANNSDSAVVEYITESTPTVDISVNKTVDHDTAYVGNQVTFTVEVVNHGLDNATEVRISDVLPSGLTYVSHTTGNGVYNTATGIWNIGPLSKNATSTLNIVVTSNVAKTYTNIANLSNVNQTDTNSNNNSDSAQVTYINESTPTVDIGVTKTVNHSTAKINDEVTFTVEVVNHGPSNATGVSFNDALPAGLNYVSHSGNGSYATSTGV